MWQRYNRTWVLGMLILGIFGALSACRKPTPSPEPLIEFLDMSKSLMRQNRADSMFLRLRFTDGDGDLGSDQVDNVFLRDSRTGELLASYRIPNYLGERPPGPREGEVRLVVYSGCCRYSDSTACVPNAAVPLDSMRYQIQVRDQTGNLSNLILSDRLDLECN